MDVQTPSQIALQYVMTTYPCLPGWVNFVQLAFVNLAAYSPPACSQVSSICQAAMKTIEYIQQNEPNAKVVRVMRVLDDLYNVAWQGWASFGAQVNLSTGTRSLQTNPDVLSGVALFQKWDAALTSTPSFDPPTTFAAMLGGVKA